MRLVIFNARIKQTTVTRIVQNQYCKVCLCHDSTLPSARQSVSRCGTRDYLSAFKASSITKSQTIHRLSPSKAQPYFRRFSINRVLKSRENASPRPTAFPLRARPAMSMLEAHRGEPNACEKHHEFATQTLVSDSLATTNRHQAPTSTTQCRRNYEVRTAMIPEPSFRPRQ